MKLAKTYSAKPTDVERQWYVLDAASAPLGRIATLAATYLSGKHKPGFTHHIDTGDGIVIVNAAKLQLTGRKLDQKLYYRHSGYPGNLRTLTAKQIIAKDPSKVIINAVKGMLPKNKLAAERLKRLRIYEGDKHDLEAQKPQTLGVKRG